MTWRKLEIRAEETREFVRKYKKRARFLVDESLGIEAARVINSVGWNAKFVCELGLGGHSDEDVMGFAWRERRLLLTHDRDFLDDRRFPPNRNAGVLVLPGAEGCTDVLERELARVLITVGRHADAYRGCKIHIRGDGSWSIRYTDPERRTDRPRLLKFQPNGDIWELF
jgi:predicted nuclease of predicted toxin-antitoxin system